MKSRRYLLKKGIYEGFGIEDCEVLEFFPGADISDRALDLLNHGEGDAAFGRTVELGQRQMGDVRGLHEGSGLRQAVLSGGGVDDQQRFVWASFDLLADDVDDLLQLLHQVIFRLEPA